MRSPSCLQSACAIRLPALLRCVERACVGSRAVHVRGSVFVATVRCARLVGVARRPRDQTAPPLPPHNAPTHHHHLPIAALDAPHRAWRPGSRHLSEAPGGGARATHGLRAGGLSDQHGLGDRRPGHQGSACEAQRRVCRGHHSPAAAAPGELQPRPARTAQAVGAPLHRLGGGPALLIVRTVDRRTRAQRACVGGMRWLRSCDAQLYACVDRRVSTMRTWC